MSGVLTMGSLDPAFAAATSVHGEPVVVDLRTVEFVEPAGLCALAALLEYLSARSRWWILHSQDATCQPIWSG